MVGGDLEAVNRCRLVLEAMGKRIFETGPLGSGHALKVLNNMLSAVGLLAATEVVRWLEELAQVKLVAK